jgi:hypothetical protein
MRNLLKALGAVAAVALVGLGLAFNALETRAGTIPLYTGASGSNPNPSGEIQPDVNALIGQINSSVAPGGTSSPLTALGFSAVATTTIQAGTSVTTTFPQIMTTSAWTTTTSTGGSGFCNFTNASGCFLFFDPNGKLRGIPFYSPGGT